jgi:predicted RNA-binding protein with RPS1 domain
MDEYKMALIPLTYAKRISPNLSFNQQINSWLFTIAKMGGALSALIKPNENADENERKKKEQLELMMKLADARLDTFEAELEKMFLDRESAMKTSVPGKRALRFERHVQVDAESTVSITNWTIFLT